MAVEKLNWGARQPPRGKVTYEEFLDWCDEDTWAEWVQGKVEMASPASLRHQDLGGFLFAVLRVWVQERDLGIVLPPFQMRLHPPVDAGREPDLVFVARAHLDRLRTSYLDGPADLVVEITSPESLRRDREVKPREYETPGVPEFWLIDLTRQYVDFNQLSPDGRYRPAQIGADGIYESQVLSGLRFPVAWLWQDPLPTHLDALRTLGLIL